MVVVQLEAVTKEVKKMMTMTIVAARLYRWLVVVQIRLATLLGCYEDYPEQSWSDHR